jgi:hypothetical protein
VIWPASVAAVVTDAPGDRLPDRPRDRVDGAGRGGPQLGEQVGWELAVHLSDDFRAPPES